MDDELTLVSRVLSGDAEAWEEFCAVYSPIIERSIRRYVRDSETRRDLYVSLLEKLKRGKLGNFAGRSTLAAWLFVVVRNHCRDYYRSEGGVRRLAAAFKDLGPNERRFFDLYYVQALPMNEVYEAMRAEKRGAISYLTLIECDETIRRRVAKKKLARLTERLLRPEAGRGCLLGVGPGLEGRDVPDTSAPSPEDRAASERLEQALRELREALLRLPPPDRRLLELRFEQGLTAKQIAEALSLGGEKQVYRRLEKLFEELRTMFGDDPAK
jgi:RNA polymerase sigma factor (sigma-70 family)